MQTENTTDVRHILEIYISILLLRFIMPFWSAFVAYSVYNHHDKSCFVSGASSTDAHILKNHFIGYLVNMCASVAWSALIYLENLCIKSHFHLHIWRKINFQLLFSFSTISIFCLFYFFQLKNKCKTDFFKIKLWEYWN